MPTLLASVFSVEGLAVVLALAYLLLAARESAWCWYCAFASSALYVVIMWDVNLYMEAALSVFYVVMAVVGWYEWRKGGKEHTGVVICTLTAKQHGALLALMLVMALINGWVMHVWTDAAWPFIDSFLAWGGVITTVMVVRKVLENWIYWFVLDAIGLYLYIDRGLYMSALLFALYLVIIVFGYLKWRKEFIAHQPAVASQTPSAP